jgi:rhodanese-related sulfurtransferase
VITAWINQLGRTAVRTVMLTAASAAVGLGFNQVREIGIPLGAETVAPLEHSSEEIPVDEAARMPGEILFVDARSRAAFAEGHLPGAVSLPYEEFETAYGEVADRLVPGIPLITYCEGGDCTLSHSLAHALRQGGYDDVRVLAGGFEAWARAGLPVEQPW